MAKSKMVPVEEFVKDCKYRSFFKESKAEGSFKGRCYMCTCKVTCQRISAEEVSLEKTQPK